MPNLVVNITPDLHEFVLTSVESGSYENANELVRHALRALLRDVRSSEKKRSVCDIAKDDVFRRLWELSIQSSTSRPEFQ
jgi:putative addiction module CopG family antidote